MTHIFKAGKLRICSGLMLTLFSCFGRADYSEHPAAADFVDQMVKQHKFEPAYVRDILAKAEKKQAILDAIARPAEKTKEWFEYRDIFIQESRITQGIEFWKDNQATLARAEKNYGVPAEIIVAIIGVETRYGRNTGSYRVIDALATLGFDYPPRADFFRGQLVEYLLMVREQEQDALALTGSYAGAMGYGQFIPSSFRSFAVDFDGDNKVDIWNNPVDAIGSVANYFHVHKWQPGEQVMLPASAGEKHDETVLNDKSRPSLSISELVKKGFSPVDDKIDPEQKAVVLTYVGSEGKQYWLGFNNFYVITRYNRSHMYARAVWELSELLKQQMMQEAPGTPAQSAAARI